MWCFRRHWRHILEEWMNKGSFKELRVLRELKELRELKDKCLKLGNSIRKRKKTIVFNSIKLL